VITAARVQLVLPNTFPLSLAVFGVGLVVTSAGIVITVLAFTRGRRRPEPVR
jgi:hypothetical protein